MEPSSLVPSEAVVQGTSRRGFLSFAWSPKANNPPRRVVQHDEGNYESRLLNGRLASFLDWPEFRLTNALGREVDLYRDILAGRSVVLSFFYTQCKGSCPVTTSRMIELCDVLRAQQRPVRFISITLEPGVDTPAVLAEYQKDVVPAGADWHLLTGKQQTLNSLRRHLGFYDLNPAVDADPRRHAAMVLMGDDRTHRWITLPAISTLRQWRSTLSRCIA